MIRQEKINEINETINSLKTIRKELIEKSQFITIEPYICYLNNDKKIKREKIIKNGKDGSACIILPVTNKGEIILDIEPRVFMKSTVGIGFPAGYIEENEEPIEAARRELMEETGYKANGLEEVGSFYQDSGCSSAFNHYFYAYDCEKVEDQKLDEGEFIKYILVNKEELAWLFENNYIKGLNDAYLYEKLKRRI